MNPRNIWFASVISSSLSHNSTIIWSKHSMAKSKKKWRMCACLVNNNKRLINHLSVQHGWITLSTAKSSLPKCCRTQKNIHPYHVLKCSIGYMCCTVLHHTVLLLYWTVVYYTALYCTCSTSIQFFQHQSEINNNPAKPWDQAIGISCWAAYLLNETSK